MLEMLKIAITGFNIIPTMLLGLILIYWITVIIGALDIDFFDIDLGDVDSEAVTGPIHGILVFLNIADLPFMVVLSVFSLVFWTISMMMHIVPFQLSVIISGILFIPYILISVIITKVITQPLKILFKDAYKPGIEKSEVEGNLCTLLCDLSSGKLGQAEVVRGITSIVINVKIGDCENIRKGEKALVIKKDKDKNFYIINKFEGV